MTVKIIFISAALVVLTYLCCAAEKNGARIEFKSSTHDFGVIKEDGGSVSCEFEFTNAGDKPLVIIQAVTSCGCTEPEYPQEPISPGKTGVIKVTYNPLGRPGAFKKEIKILTNGTKKRTTLNIIGNSVPPMKKEKK